MKISMITSSRNGMPYLQQCLSSIVAASRGLDVEILYEDCCSTDGSAECARQLIGASRVNVEPDEGFGDAVNRAFRKCTGEVIGALPADDLLSERSLHYVAEAFSRNPEAKWGIGMYEIIDSEGRPTRHLHTAYKNFAVRHFSRSWLMAENIIPFVSFYIRRDFRVEVGDFLHESRTTTTTSSGARSGRVRL
jgi:glycosyltransferase involved in cell wall biosynthesis